MKSLTQTFLSAMSLPLALLRPDLNCCPPPLRQNIDKHSFHVQMTFQRIPQRITKEFSKNSQTILQKIPKILPKFPKIPPKIQEFPQNFQDFKTIQFLTSHLEAKNPFRLVYQMLGTSIDNVYRHYKSHYTTIK